MRSGPTTFDRSQGYPSQKPTRSSTPVADAVTSAQIAIVRTGRKAVGAVNRKIGAQDRPTQGYPAQGYSAHDDCAQDDGEADHQKAASRTKHTVRRAAKKARRSVGPR